MTEMFYWERSAFFWVFACDVDVILVSYFNCVNRNSNGLKMREDVVCYYIKWELLVLD